MKSKATEIINGTYLSVPTSPTDKVFSPCTKSIWMQSKKEQFYSQSLSNSKEPESLLKSSLQMIKFPAEGKHFILGTSSSSRKAIVDALQWKYLQISPDIDGKFDFDISCLKSFEQTCSYLIIIEKAIRCSNPTDLPLLIAKAKADALLNKLREVNDGESYILLSADQIVLFGDTVREKPVDEAEAIAFLSSYSDSSVSTVSAVVITELPSGAQTSGVDVATVHWDTLSEEVVRRVVSRGEIFSSAGGFRVEDEDLTPLIRRVDGSVDSVMGLPVDMTVALIEEVIKLSGRP